MVSIGHVTMSSSTWVTSFPLLCFVFSCMSRLELAALSWRWLAVLLALVGLIVWKVISWNFRGLTFAVVIDRRHIESRYGRQSPGAGWSVGFGIYLIYLFGWSSDM